MNLLLTNDDGFQSLGLEILASELAKENNVFIVAPDSNRSAVSHHFTMFNENIIRVVDKNFWNCSGYPADCVFAGTSGALFEEKIDAVIAGINYGSNLGTDIVYSGTCGAARQALLQNIPALALSIDPVDWSKANKEGFKFEALARFVANNLKELISMVKMDFPRAFVNINGVSTDSYKGVKAANELCKRNYGDSLAIEAEENGELHTKIVFGNNGTEENPNSDFSICREGYIAVSKVYVDPICCAFDKDFSNWVVK